MANTIKLKRASGSDPSASDLSVGELAIRTSNCKLFSRNDGGSAVGIVAGSADTLTTARTIAGVSFDGSANISLNNNAITNGAGFIADLVSDTSPQLGGNLDVQSNKITTATSNGNVKIEPNGSGVVEVRGAGGNDGKLQLNCSAQSHGIKLASPAHSAGQSYTLIFPDNQIAADKYLKIKSISGSGSTAIGQAEYASLDANDLGEGTIPDARFPSTLPALNGSALTNLNGSNIASGTIAAARIATLNQNTTGSSASCTGNAATATALANARTIAGVSFDGTANISLNNNAITNGAGYLTSVATSNIADNAVTFSKLEDVAQNHILGRVSSGTSDCQELSASEVRTILNVENGATADQSASEILTLIKTVDGSGSGLDADLLDGLDSAFFVNASNLSSGTIPDARFPSTLPAVDGSNLTGISAGATGGGSDEIFYENGQNVTTNYTITNGKNAMSAGPITIDSGVTVTVGAGETLTIV